MSIGIIGVGGYAPEKRLTNQDLEKMVDTSDEWITERTGIKERRIAERESTLDLAIKAAREAIEDAGIKAEELGLIIVSSITPDRTVPMCASEVMKAIGASCAAFDINAACSGFVYALTVATKLFEERPVLVISAEKLSKAVDWKDRNTCVLFGDAAGAVVIDRREDASEILYTDIQGLPDRNECLTLKDVIGMNGREVFRFAVSTIPRDISRCVEALGMSPEEIDWIVPHQANTRIIRLAAAKVGIPMERFYLNIDRMGNTSSASVPYALYELKKSGRLKKGQLIALNAFGGGLTHGLVLMKW